MCRDVAGIAGMKGHTKVIAHLNAVLTNELTAIDQYFLHAKMFEHWGFKRLGELERKASIDEMKHADSLMERILFLEGLPNLQDLHKLLVGENVQEALACDLKLELTAHPDLKSAIADCESLGDYVSRDLFRGILTSEEDHIDWLETQLELIGKIGIANYQQSAMGDAN
jgi:bacterioferritin